MAYPGAAPDNCQMAGRHIYDSGFEVENCEKAREILDEAGLVREEVQELSGAGRMLRSMKIAFYMGRGGWRGFCETTGGSSGLGRFFHGFAEG